jgi:hypothetical protein
MILVCMRFRRATGLEMVGEEEVKLRPQDDHSVGEFRRGEAVALASSPRTVAFL